jgi:hypothetical protein
MNSRKRHRSHERVVPDLMHLIVKWNSAKGFERETIAAHARILRGAPANKRYVWWGKFSKSGGSGLSRPILTQFRRQLKIAAESHLYLYCPDKSHPSLHVGLVAAAQTAHPREPAAVPEYYSRLPYPAAFWFRLTDLRELSLETLENLYLSNGQAFDPASSHLYPLVVHERRPLVLFNYKETSGAKWYALQSLDTSSGQSKSMNPRLVFAIMPFAPEFHDVYQLAIKPTVEELGLECKRADDFFHIRDIMDVIRENITAARLIVADMSDNNPNVFYELGYAQGIGKSVILITKDRSKVPFDLRAINSIEYTRIADLKNNLRQVLDAFFADSLS